MLANTISLAVALTVAHRQNSTQIDELVKASGLGRTDEIRRLLKLGVDPNGVARNPVDTPLGAAAWGDQLEAVQILIAAGATPNKAGRNERSPLGITIERSRNDVIARLLIKNGANPNGLPEFDPPLMMAVATGRLDLCKFLLKTGATVNTEERKSGASPLQVAAGHDSTEIAKVLLANGAKLEHQDKRGNTPLMQAVIHYENLASDGKPKTLSIIRLLIHEGASTSTKNENGDSPLGLATKIGDPTLTSALG